MHERSQHDAADAAAKAQVVLVHAERVVKFVQKLKALQVIHVFDGGVFILGAVYI